MKTAFKKAFLKSIRQIRDEKLKDAIADIIQEVEAAESITDIGNTKKLKGYKQFYRIRTGDYRIGVKVAENTVTFAAFDHRKDIDKHFP
jgi:mRNA interferase RelE/StbE